MCFYRHLSLLDIVQVRHRDVKGAFLSINTSTVLGILMPDTVVAVACTGGEGLHDVPLSGGSMQNITLSGRSARGVALDNIITRLY